MSKEGFETSQHGVTAIVGTVVLVIAATLVVGSLLQFAPSPTLMWERQFVVALFGRRDSTRPGKPITAQDEVELASNQIRGAQAAHFPSELADGYYIRATAYLRLGRYDLALRDSSLGLRVQGTSLDSLCGLYLIRGAIQTQSREYADANKDFGAALKICRSNWTAFYARANLRVITGNASGAVSDCNEVFVKLPAEQALLQRELVSFPGSQNTVKRTMSAFRRWNAMTHLLRGAAYRGLNRNEQSLDDYNAAIAELPNDASAYSGRAQTELAMGKWGAGLSDFWQRLALSFGRRRG